MSGLASLNRYHRFPWQGVPQRGELEYLDGAKLSGWWRSESGSVTHGTEYNRHTRQNAPTVKPTGQLEQRR